MINSIWGIIGGALILAVALLVWFARRPGRSDDEDSTGVWESLQQDDIDGESLASTERLRALASQEDSAIVVVEQESALTPPEDSMPEPAEDSLADTFEVTVVEDEPETVFDTPEPVAQTPDIEESVADIEHDRSLDDTFQSETAINLDQADPAAEADFHMAYGLYDQAADLINGALEVDSENEDLLAKLSSWVSRSRPITRCSRASVPAPRRKRWISRSTVAWKRPVNSTWTSSPAIPSTPPAV